LHPNDTGAAAAPKEDTAMPARLVFAGALAAMTMGACAPTVQLAGTPDKPITINLNVKIDQEVRIKLDKEVSDMISKNKDVF
jgi:hypothetical protein